MIFRAVMLCISENRQGREKRACVCSSSKALIKCAVIYHCHLGPKSETALPFETSPEINLELKNLPVSFFPPICQCADAEPWRLDDSVCSRKLSD